eukprot:15435527-Alexandrium_andersonii.AAC.1
MAPSLARGCCASCCSRLRSRCRGGSLVTSRSSPGSLSTPGMYSVSTWSARAARRLTSASSGNRSAKRGSSLPRGS